MLAEDVIEEVELVLRLLLGAFLLNEVVEKSLDLLLLLLLKARASPRRPLGLFLRFKFLFLSGRCLRLALFPDIVQIAEEFVVRSLFRFRGLLFRLLLFRAFALGAGIRVLGGGGGLLRPDQEISLLGEGGDLREVFLLFFRRDLRRRLVFFGYLLLDFLEGLLIHITFEIVEVVVLGVLNLLVLFLLPG